MVKLRLLLKDQGCTEYDLERASWHIQKATPAWARYSREHPASSHCIDLFQRMINFALWLKRNPAELSRWPQQRERLIAEHVARAPDAQSAS